MSTERRSDRGRGRPRQGDIVLSRDLIVETALAIAGAEGFAALSMHRLARQLDVTPRALYNHVADWQEVIDLAAARMLQHTPMPAFDHPDWRDALRDAYDKARQAYRAYPRATLISLDETVSATSVDPHRVILAERLLQFLVDLGLTLPQALVIRSGFLFDVFAFTLLIDYRYDRGDDELRRMMSQPVPEAWLDSLPDVVAPRSREASDLDPRTSDEMFAETIAMRIATIEHLLE